MKNYPFYQCRAMGHAWTVDYWGPLDQAPMELPSTHIYRHWRLVRVSFCDSCQTQRLEYFADSHIDPADNWKVVHRYYRRDRRYSVEGGMKRTAANEALYGQLRKENARRKRVEKQADRMTDTTRKLA